MGEESRKRRRKNLFEQNDGLCYWCNRETVYNPSDSLNPRMATIDHIKNKISKRYSSNENQLTVLACRRCNNLRSKFEDAFYFAIDESLKPKQPHPKGELLEKATRKLGSKLVKFLEDGGKLDASGIETKNSTRLKRIFNILRVVKNIKNLRKMPKESVK